MLRDRPLATVSAVLRGNLYCGDILELLIDEVSLSIFYDFETAVTSQCFHQVDELTELIESLELKFISSTGVVSNVADLQLYPLGRTVSFGLSDT